MDKAKIIDTVAKASFYSISEATFIKQIVASGVTSYLIDIVDFSLIFKGKEKATFDNPIPTDQTLFINLLRKEQQTPPLMVKALKQAGVSKYEVFLPEMRMVFYNSRGEQVKYI